MTTTRTMTGTVTKREDGTVALMRSDVRAGVSLHVELSAEEVSAISSTGLCGAGVGGGETCMLPFGHAGKHDPDA